MFWNHLLHIVCGVLGADIFVWSSSGVLASVGISSATQAIDTVRIYFHFRERALNQSEEAFEALKRNSIYTIPQLFLFKTIWYGLVILITAQITR